MGLSTVTLLGMLIAPGQAPADTKAWNAPSMTIPIDYHPSKRGEIRELLLYVSPDQGQTWQQHATATPERDTAFTFNAPADGVYWFNMVVVDKTGRRDPADVFKAAPALKVLFDTKKPVVQVPSAQRVGDDVTVVWKVAEKNPDWNRFRLEYSANGTSWVPVPTRGEMDGSAQFKVPAGANLTVRVSLTDLAGHVGEAIAPVAGTPTAVAAGRPAGDPIIPVQGTADPALPPVIGGTGSAPGIALPPGPPATDRARDSRLPGEPRGADTPAFPPAPGAPNFPVVGPGDPAGGRPDPVGVSTAALSHLPAPQAINVTSFKLAYEVEGKGASGVSKADVYVTRDDGRTWTRWQSIDKPDSPLVVELARNSQRDLEGIYGVKVLLQSGAGLSREAPRAGEAPDLRVDVDITPPVVHIYAPVPDGTQTDTMILRWVATDRNLAADPITLEWADGPKGPWYPIVAADGPSVGSGGPKRLPNSGSYPWKLPANFPAHKVYLKVTARDTAGNLAEAITPEAQLIDLNKPAAVKLNIVGGGR